MKTRLVMQDNRHARSLKNERSQSRNVILVFHLSLAFWLLLRISRGFDGNQNRVGDFNCPHVYLLSLCIFRTLLPILTSEIQYSRERTPIGIAVISSQHFVSFGNYLATKAKSLATIHPITAIEQLWIDSTESNSSSNER